jgi:hypothetical protein
MSEIMLWAHMKGMNELVNIVDVIKTEGKEFVCIGCRSDVFPRQGDHNRHHFAHYVDAGCERPGESIFRRLLKEVLYTEKKVMLPDGMVVEFTRVDKEFWIEDMRIDAVMVGDGGRKIAVEVVVTCDLGDTKLQRLRRMGYEVLVLNCSQMDRNMSWDELVQWVTASCDDRDWYDVKVERAATSSVAVPDWLNVAFIICCIVAAFLLIRAFVRKLSEGNKRHRSYRYKYRKMRYAYAKY